MLANNAASDATIPQGRSWIMARSVRVVMDRRPTRARCWLDYSATGAITFVPATGVTGVSVFRYEVFDWSTPVSLAGQLRGGDIDSYCVDWADDGSG